ncbi:DUF6114 domain-containing protein [Catenulispora rubra]|uniref:DUF6114 domain-containing protein n=1 Tax=Catenulispora rubra TaxID=280293 RepID=UPI00189274E8|nr:DUF6114 domain-containing protein [Catenulispora rubra]
MSTIDVEMAGSQEHPVVRGWRAFRVWRRSRPFWAGLWTLVAALELWSIPFLQPLMTQGKLNVKIAGIAGVSTMAITPALIMMAIAMWFAPGYRVFAGVFTLVCALLSLVVSNFGGFLLGMLLGVFGGGLAFSWTPRLTEEQIAAQARAEQAYRDALAGDMPPSARAPLAASAADSADGADEPTIPGQASLYQFQGAEEQYSAAGPIPGVAGYQGTKGEMTSALPQAGDPASADTVPATPPRDVVPPLPRAEDTPAGGMTS